MQTLLTHLECSPSRRAQPLSKLAWMDTNLLNEAVKGLGVLEG